MLFIFSIIFLTSFSGLICFFAKKTNIRKIAIISFFVSCIVMSIVLYMTFLFFKTENIYSIKIGTFFNGSIIFFKTTGISMLFCSMVALLYPVSIIYTVAYVNINNIKNQNIFFCFIHFSIMLSFCFGMSGNMITMFMFYELITIFTYVLVVHNKDIKAKKAGRIYLVYLVFTSSVLLLPGIIIIQSIVGNTAFVYGGVFKNIEMSDLKANILFFIVMFGIAKTTIFPLYYWLPRAMIAPTPVSAILHAVVVVKSGLFISISAIYFLFGHNFLEKHLYKFYGENLLTILSVSSIFIMSVVAMFQDNIKKRLAYSTISQLSYSLLCASFFSGKAMITAMLLMFAHAFAKITMFFGSGIIYSYFHKQNLTEIYGIGRKIPITIVAMCVACLSIMGLPVTIGFGAKYELLSMIIGYKDFFIVFMIVVSTLLSVSYCFSIIYNAVFVRQRGSYVQNNVSFVDNFITLSVMLFCIFVIVSLFFCIGFIKNINFFIT